MLKQGDTITLRISRLGTNGEGVAVYDEYTVFVPFALVGEEVVARIEYVKRDVAHAEVVAVGQSSQARVCPPCAYFGACGGCQLQHMNYSNQLAFKHGLVQDTFRKLGGLDIDAQSVVYADSCFGYRNKLTLPVGGRRGQCLIGMYRSNSHKIVDINCCMLSDQWADRVIAICREYFDRQLLEPYNETTHKGQIRHISARYHNSQLLLTVVTNGAVSTNWRMLYQALSESFDQCGLFVNINNCHNNVIMGDTTQHICGIKAIQGVTNDIRYSVRADSFFQVNDAVKDKLYGKVRDIVRELDTDVLIDCYSGVGLLTGELYSDSFDTYAIEIDADSVADANSLKQNNDMSRLTNICGDANVELPRLFAKLRADKPDAKITLVVDPPRKGLGSAICCSLLETFPANIIYISCDPATLARDIKQLVAQYSVASVIPYDMFPMTKHVETVCLLSKLRADHHIEVNLNMDELNLTSAESKATYDEIKDYVLKNSGFKVSSLYIGQVKEKMGIKERENYNISKKEDAKVPQCPADKEKAIIEAFKHFNMID